MLESKLNKNLNETVIAVFGYSLEQFAKDIQDNEKFNEMLKKKIEFDKKQKSDGPKP
eukprot:CAMPEP_0114584196 /NCGR_PEP_ID=MMETSP0125-20121206/7915_1 /TAXON_ID=485358 ORGANISM="Aristerostoma sp., Strain ATCC 50986" /NCGR_SAMPLE_ID=MMETSP0125 /ASSEMBLY_ACC=CAM_ASM_000245 /LENGTH=56 /DNA_ID=CAMNT_0001778383 /DNA_START=348 /DNA_END=518 /DNA_ORIENTATION=-